MSNLDREQIVDDVVYNFFMDVRKRDIDKRSRAMLLREYMEKHNLTQRAIAKEIGVSHSTIGDWLLIDKISEEEYNKLREEGYTETQIYRTLRNNNKDVENIPLNILALREATNKAKTFYKEVLSKTNESFDPETHEIIKELINVLNRVLIKSERI